MRLIDLFAKGIDNAIWHKLWDGRNWSDFGKALGESLYPLQQYLRLEKDRLDLFAIGTNNRLWHRWWACNSWNYWEGLGGKLIYAPPSIGELNSIDVIAVNRKGNLVHKYWWR